MVERVWDQFLTEHDKAHLAVMRQKTAYGFGVKPAVLCIDNYRGGIGDRPEPLLEATKTWPGSTGQAGWTALEHVAELLTVARATEVPLIHITGLAEEDSGMAGWSAGRGGRGKRQRTKDQQERHLRRYDFVDQAAPLRGELVLKKNSPSAFFGTPLASHLMGEGIDTLIVCGQSVSGCVRATVVDGCSYRLRMIVVEECVYDRHEATRAINLFDMNQKYADVVSLATVSEWMKSRSGRTNQS